MCAPWFGHVFGGGDPWFVGRVSLVLMVPWVGEWVVTRQLSTSIFGRSSIIDETATTFVPSMPCSRRTTNWRPPSPILQSLFSFHPLFLLVGSLSLTLSLYPNDTTTTRAGESRRALSTLLVSLHQALPCRPLQGCAHLRPQPSIYFQNLRAFRHSRSFATASFYVACRQGMLLKPRTPVDM